MKTQANMMFKVAIVLGTLLLVFGCEPSIANKKLKVGKVDTAVLLRDDPTYQNLSIEYMKENMALREKFLSKFKNAGESETARQDVQKAYSSEQKKLDGKWMSKTQDFLESSHSSIRELAQKIAEAKDIDIVIIDSKEYPTVEWGGVDITPDLALSKTQGSNDSEAASPTPATPKPQKEG